MVSIGSAEFLLWHMNTIAAVFGSNFASNWRSDPAAVLRGLRYAFHIDDQIFIQCFKIGDRHIHLPRTTRNSGTDNCAFPRVYALEWILLCGYSRRCLPRLLHYLVWHLRQNLHCDKCKLQSTHQFWFQNIIVVATLASIRIILSRQAIRSCSLKDFARLKIGEDGLLFQI